MEPIGPGAAGPAVSDVQARLTAAGYEVDDVPGRYGSGTTAAVRRFQQERRLLADGVVGADTWVVLVDAAYGFGDRLLYETRPPQRGDDVLELQQRLSQLGFDCGPLDGILGEFTAAAIREFQHNCGIDVDGIVGQSTVARLDSLHRDHQAALSFEVLDRIAPGTTRLGPGARVVVDPARGPDAPGVTVDGVAESQVVWDVATRVVGHLAALGASPLLTRGVGTTPTAAERAALANAHDAACVVSLRCAGLDQPSARGVAGFYFGTDRARSERGRLLALRLVNEVASTLDTPNCRTHPSGTAILRESRPPAVVLEVGYMTHPVEGPRLRDPGYRHRLAGAVATGVLGWLTADGDARARVA